VVNREVFSKKKIRVGGKRKKALMGFYAILPKAASQHLVALSCLARQAKTAKKLA
jgi:hypothetical protein